MSAYICYCWGCQLIYSTSDVAAGLGYNTKQLPCMHSAYMHTELASIGWDESGFINTLLHYISYFLHIPVTVELSTYPSSTKKSITVRKNILCNAHTFLLQITSTDSCRWGSRLHIHHSPFFLQPYTHISHLAGKQSLLLGSPTNTWRGGEQ